MGLENYFLAGRKTAVVLGLTGLLGLTSCQTILQIPVKAAQEVIEITSRIARFPTETIESWLKKEPGLNKCVEDENEKVCRTYLRKEFEFGVYEEFRGVLYIRKGPLQDPKRRYKLIASLYNSDVETVLGEPILMVVRYIGESSEDFIDPEYGREDYPLDKFKHFFAKPRARKFDDSNNQFKNLERVGLVERKMIRDVLRETMEKALRLADEQLPKYN